jgi:hypothetical protein
MKKKCPFFKTPCMEHDCRMWINVQGIHPQTGETVNEWDCSINWVPVLLVEVAKQARGGAAATESFRNVVLSISQRTRHEETEPPRKIRKDG